MKIFLTGCNGLVGSFVARKLLSQNHSIKALKRESSDLCLLKDIAREIEWVEGDICDIVLMEKCLEEVEVLIHAAAMVSFFPSEKSEMLKVNVEGTATLVNAALKAGIKKFIHISSIAALGRKKGTTLISENTYWENSTYNSNYAASKYLGEMEVWRGFEEGLKGFIVNPSVVLGAGNWNNGSTKLFRYVWDKHRFYPEGEVNYIDVRDVTDIICLLMNEEKALGHRFILNGGKISYKELFSRIADCFKIPAPRYRAGKILSEIAWRWEALKSFLSGDKPLVTKETARLSGRSFDYDNSKVKNLLNYKFRTVEDTVGWVCGELRQRYNV